MAAEKFYLNFGAVALIVDTRSVAVGSRGTLAGIVRQRPTSQKLWFRVRIDQIETCELEFSCFEFSLFVVHLQSPIICY